MSSTDGAAGADDSSGDSGICGGPAADSVCRDYLRHVCRRGRRCRYRHPEAGECALLSRAEIVFCHDYQNAGCPRPNCRFAHCSREEEAAYRATGEVPVRLRCLISTGDQPPVCKDHLKGDCKRAAKCRFRHVTPAELLAAAVGDCEQQQQQQQQKQQQQFYDMAKRRKLESDYEQAAAAVSATAALAAFSPPPPPPPPPPLQQLATPSAPSPAAAFAVDPATLWAIVAASTAANAAAVATPSAVGSPCEARRLVEENCLLQRRADELRMQCAQLLASNDLLAQQNARLRCYGKPPPPLPQSSLVPPTSAISCAPLSTAVGCIPAVVTTASSSASLAEALVLAQVFAAAAATGKVAPLH